MSRAEPPPDNIPDTFTPPEEVIIADDDGYVPPEPEEPSVPPLPDLDLDDI